MTVNKVATSDKVARTRLFDETGARMDLHPAIVEKDFWVCWLLKQLFTIEELNGWLVFKGGTSLSKCFNLIQRFSEDLDIAVDFEKLGFTESRDPRQASLSHTKRAPLLASMLAECQRYVAGRLPDLRRDYEAMNVMFFGEPPTFDDVMSNLANLEHKING